MPTRMPMPGDPGYGPVVRHGRNPLAVCMFLVLFLSGLVGLWNPEEASPLLTRVLGEWVWTWHIGLVIGAGTALAGVLILRSLNDVLIERIGCIWLATLFFSYGVVVSVMNGAFLTTYSGLTIGLGFAFASRAWQVTKDLQRLQHVLRSLPARGDAHE